MRKGDEAWWRIMGVLFRRRWFIVISTSAVAIAAIVISLLLPNWYKASSRLLLPQDSGGGLASALTGDLSSAAASLLGTGGGDYIRYLAILSSRSVKMEVVEEFDLVTVYETVESEHPEKVAMDILTDNVEFVIDDEFNFMSIEVFDRDPERAAAISNFFVQVLDRVNNRVTSQTAGNFRRYVEERYREAELDRQALLDSLASFQRRYGVFDLEAQTQAFFEQIAQFRADALQAEIQYEAMKAQFGPDNPTVKNLESVVEAVQDKVEAAMSGQEMVMPVPRSEAPDMVRQYADLMMDRTIQERILELVAPMLEQARFEEQRQAEALQVVDAAVPPVEKAKPVRSLIVIGATVSAFILSVMFVLLLDWWRRNSRTFAERLRRESVMAGT